ncbi:MULTISPECIES: Gfo/Idh/MocA family oxidoreductase [Cryobacterium]|uniref:Oxidoreductase n=1 Tax=Cryobacterium breve TaxID=1259258 RepID=A0ABY2J5X9_9MICO|nr:MULTISPECIES: Gfo/Idh/MocA family oxidoreductase [Cryobacterium]TFC90936.1 oxidoreductase [Cryobacterium sp. TmT3-12]TFC99255.1 oxidoreductase [Cryobacterium breve]
MTQSPASVAPIRTGLIGFGTSGRVFHSPLLAANPEFSLEMIVTRDPVRREVAAERHPGVRLVSSADDVFAAVDDLDLVVIGSPSGTHVKLAHAALDAGLAVVVDKPFAVKARDGRDLIEKAERLGLLFTVFQNRRWDGDFLTLRALLATGALGEVRRFESRFEWWKPEQTKAWKVGATIEQGGGVLFDLGAHLIDQALQLFGPVDDVYAETVTRRQGGVADDDTFVALHHGSGVRSHLWMNGIAAQVGPRFHVLGSESGYTKWGLDGQETALAAGAQPTDPGFGVDPETAWGVLGRDGALTRVPAERGNYAAFYTGLADSILRGAPVPVDPRESLRTIALIERINLLTH